MKNQVYNIVKQIPRGKVMTYGQIAALAGSPRAARQVGGIAKYGPDDLPWHRVVRKDGGLASGFPGGMQNQKHFLEQEGVNVSKSYLINVSEYIFWPSNQDR